MTMKHVVSANSKALQKIMVKYKDSITLQPIVVLRKAGNTIHETAELAGCSISQLKRIWAIHKNQIMSSD